MGSVLVTAERFDVSAELGRLSEPGVGGLGCFVGVVRAGGPEAAGAALTALTLEHYPGMTERAIGVIVAQAEARFGLLGCRVVHRIGRLGPGEPIVLVVAAAAHREAALQATSFLIDWLKTRAPFWKCEEFADGTRRWVEGRDADELAAARWDGQGAACPD